MKFHLRSAKSELSSSKHTEINFESILSNMYVKEMPNLDTTHTHLGLFGVVKFCSLRGEGRSGWKGRFKNGVRMKHMITLV